MWADYFTLPWIARGSSDEALAGAVGGIADGLSGDLAKNFSVSAKTLKAVENVQKGFLPGLANATAIHEAAVVCRLVKNGVAFLCDPIIPSTERGWAGIPL